METPKLTARYRPKDAGILREIVKAAWNAKTEEFNKRTEAINEIALNHVESLYPHEDMLVLQRYGVARQRDGITIRLYNRKTKRWDVLLQARFPRPVLMPDSDPELCGLCPDWWDEPDLGIIPDHRAKMSPEEWGKLVARNEEDKARRLPPEKVNPFFEEYLELREQHQSDDRIRSWIDSFRKEKGKYPTWGEIFDQSPVLASWVA